MRRLGWAVVLLLVAGCGGSTPRPATPTPTPTPVPTVRADAPRHGVVFVLTDDLSTDLLRYMPHVRALARRGTTFRRYVVADSRCCPSRASIFTGRLPHNTRVLTNQPPLGGYRTFRTRGEERATFATALQGAGYRTALFGKYLNGFFARFPAPPGWDDFASTNFGYDAYGYVLNHDDRRRYHGARPRDYMTTVLGRLALRFLDRAAAERRPFLLQVSTFAPHEPAVPAPRDRDAFPGLRAPRSPAFDRVDRGAPRWLARRAPLTRADEREIDRLHRRRAQSVLAVDRLVGDIGARLRQLGIADTTDVVFSSDNGFHMGEHRLLPGKMTAFDTDVRAPLIVAGPDARRGVTVDALAQNTDLGPTFAAIAGTSLPGADGRSLLPLLRTGRAPADWRRAALIEHQGRRGTRADPDFQEVESGNPPTYDAVRTATGTYVQYADGERERYDDRRDPFQTDDLWDETPPAERRRLAKLVAGLATCRGAACSRHPNRPPIRTDR